MFQPIRTYSKRKRNVLASLNLETSANLKTLKDITEETFLETISPLLASQEQLIENLSKSSSNKLDFNFDEENEILKEHSPPSVSIKDSDDSSQNSSGSTQKRSRKRQKQNPSDGNSTPLKSSLGRVDDARNNILQDDIDYILSGLSTTQSIIVRRGNVFNLAKQCKEKSLSLGQCLRSQGLMDNLIQLLDQNLPDEIIALTTSAFMYFFTKDSNNGEYVTPSFVQLLFRLLFESNQFSEEKEMKPLEKMAVLDVYNKTTKLFPFHESVSCVLLILQIMVRLLSLSKYENLVKKELVQANVLNLIIGTTEVLCKKIEKNSIINNETKYYLFEEIAACFLLLEHATLFDFKIQQQLTEHKSLLLNLIKYFKFSSQKFLLELNLDNSQNNCFTLNLQNTLKLLINLSHQNSKACSLVGNQGIIQTICQILQLRQKYSSSSIFHDFIIQLVGFLINIVETDDGNRIKFQNNLNSVAKRTRHQKRKNQNEDLTIFTPLNIIVDFFIELSIEISKDSNLNEQYEKATNFFFPSFASSKSKEKTLTEKKVRLSYVAILLGLLALDKTNKRVIGIELAKVNQTQSTKSTSTFYTRNTNADVIDTIGSMNSEINSTWRNKVDGNMILKDGSITQVFQDAEVGIGYLIERIEEFLLFQLKEGLLSFQINTSLQQLIQTLKQTN